MRTGCSYNRGLAVGGHEAGAGRDHADAESGEGAAVLQEHGDGELPARRAPPAAVRTPAQHPHRLQSVRAVRTVHRSVSSRLALL